MRNCTLAIKLSLRQPTKSSSDFHCPLCTHSHHTCMHTFAVSVYKNLISTLKNSKNEIALCLGPYSSGLYSKKKKLVRPTSKSSVMFLYSLTRSSRSWRLSRPLKNALGILSSHGGPALPNVESISNCILGTIAFNEILQHSYMNNLHE